MHYKYPLRSLTVIMMLVWFCSTSYRLLYRSISSQMWPCLRQHTDRQTLWFIYQTVTDWINSLLYTSLKQIEWPFFSVWKPETTIRIDPMTDRIDCSCHYVAGSTASSGSETENQSLHAGVCVRQSKVSTKDANIAKEALELLVTCLQLRSHMLSESLLGQSH